MPYVEYDEVQAVCSDCGRQFPSEEALADHRLEAHGGLEAPASRAPASFPCSLCPAVFRSAPALQTHNRKVHSG